LVWRVVIGFAIGLAVAWLALIVGLYLARPKGSLLKEATRLVPDTIRLLRRLASDHDIPRGIRIRLSALFIYLALPIDLIPDFIPVVGFADDAIFVAIALRSVVKHAGPRPFVGTGPEQTTAWPACGGLRGWNPRTEVAVACLTGCSGRP